MPDGRRNIELSVDDGGNRIGDRHVDAEFMREPRSDAYRMLAHDAGSQKYIALPSGFAYMPRRVKDGYAMPPCDLVS